jgi:Putative peptidoglycan binding domain
MENVKLDLEPGEFLSEFDEIEDNEAINDEFDSINNGPLLEDELLDNEEIRRFRPNISRRPIRSRPRFASSLNRRRPLRARFPRRTRPRPPRLPWMGRPGFRRRIVAGHPAPCNCPTPGTEYARWVQTSLNQVMGLNLAVNGVMNAETRSALRQFQQQRGLPVDGIAGPETKTALMAARGEKTIPTSAPSPPGSDSAELDFMPGEEGEEFIDALWQMHPNSSTAPFEIDPVLREESNFDEDSDVESREAWRWKPPRRKPSRRKRPSSPPTELCFWVADRLKFLKVALDGLNKAFRQKSRNDIKDWLAEVTAMVNPIIKNLRAKTFSPSCKKRDLKAFAESVEKLLWPKTKSAKRLRARLVAAIRSAAK